MNNALKGALLSGLILPGLGQLVFRQYVRGTVLIMIVLGSITIFAIKIVRLTLVVIAETQAGNGTLSLSAIHDSITQASAHSSWPTFSLLSLLLLACWIISVVDAYFTGKKLDLKG